MSFRFFFVTLQYQVITHMDKMTKRERWNAKLADLFIDMGKYTATAIFITSIIGEFKEKWLLYGISLTLVAVFIFMGFWIINKK